MKQIDYKVGDKVIILPDAPLISVGYGKISLASAKNSDYKPDFFRKVKDYENTAYTRILVKRVVGVVKEIHDEKIISIDGIIYPFCLVRFTDGQECLTFDWYCTYSLTPIVKEVEKNEIIPLDL